MIRFAIDPAFVAAPLSGVHVGPLVLDGGVAVIPRAACRPAFTPKRFAIAAVRFVAAALIALVRACVLPSRVLPGCLPGPRSPSRFSSSRAPSAVSASSGSPSAFVALLSPLASGAGSLHAGISWQRPLGESPAFRVRTATPLQARFSSRLFSHALSAPSIAASIRLSLVSPGLWVPNKALQRTRLLPGSPWLCSTCKGPAPRSARQPGR